MDAHFYWIYTVVLAVVVALHALGIAFSFIKIQYEGHKWTINQPYIWREIGLMVWRLNASLGIFVILWSFAWLYFSTSFYHVYAMWLPIVVYLVWKLTNLRMVRPNRKLGLPLIELAVVSVYTRMPVAMFLTYFVWFWYITIVLGMTVATLYVDLKYPG